jgi:hypothetical protein
MAPAVFCGLDARQFASSTSSRSPCRAALRATGGNGPEGRICSRTVFTHPTGRLRVALDVERLHFFDPETEDSIW